MFHLYIDVTIPGLELQLRRLLDTLGGSSEVDLRIQVLPWHEDWDSTAAFQEPLPLSQKIVALSEKHGILRTYFKSDPHWRTIPWNNFDVYRYKLFICKRYERHMRGKCLYIYSSFELQIEPRRIIY